MPGHLRIDRELSGRRIAAAVDTLSEAAFTSSDTAICRYAYTPEYERTLDWFRAQFDELGYQVWEDPLGTFVAENRAAGAAVFGLGSHCDSNRNGGPWDGTLGVVVGLEVCRLAREHGLEHPLRVISFLEEEGSGFGQLLLGSRACAGLVDEAELRGAIRAVDDGRSFWDHAVDAGRDPTRWRECSRVLDDLDGWIECHIEQGRVLQDRGERLGLVDGIAGYVRGDLELTGRADHAGATPMSHRVDALAAAAEITLELERLATAAGSQTVATVGELDISPGLIGTVPGAVRMSLDIRGVDDHAVRDLARAIVSFAEVVCERRGGSSHYAERQSATATQMSDAILEGLAQAAALTGERYGRIVSGAAHDTASVAGRVPSAMVFVPCVDGISHSPDESSDPADAALACEVILNAVAVLAGG